jgi:hypothetical protein
VWHNSIIVNQLRKQKEKIMASKFQAFKRKDQGQFDQDRMRALDIGGGCSD